MYFKQVYSHPENFKPVTFSEEYFWVSGGVSFSELFMSTTPGDCGSFSVSRLSTLKASRPAKNKNHPKHMQIYIGPNLIFIDNFFSIFIQKKKISFTFQSA